MTLRFHARIQEFSPGGVQVSLTKISSDKVFFLFYIFFFSSRLILQKSNSQFQRNLSFFKVPEGVQHFPGGGGPLFPGGVQLLIPYRNPYNLWFSRGVRTPCPPLWIRTWIWFGLSINGLVTDGNTKLCCRGFILALFQSTTANEIDSEHTWDYKRLLPVCEAEILRVTVKRIEVFSSFYVDFWRFSAKSAEDNLKRVHRFLADVHKDG